MGDSGDCWGGFMGALGLPTRRWSRDEYERLIDAGILGTQDHVELLQGEITLMSPQSERHVTAISLALATLQQAFGPSHWIRVQSPFPLGADTVPEPDIVVVPGAIRSYGGRRPTEALLAIEVADASLSTDRHVKGPLYAQGGVPDYWILNVADRTVEVYREPSTSQEGTDYRLIRTFRSGECVPLLALPAISIAVDDLLP
jgi:Uma2 family endonuclease